MTILSVYGLQKSQSEGNKNGLFDDLMLKYNQRMVIVLHWKIIMDMLETL